MSTPNHRTDNALEDGEYSREELVTQLELLAEENQQLRESYTRAKQSQYRRTALGLTVLGIIGVGGALLFPPAREISLALGSIGLFGGILTYYLTPEQFVSADVGRDVYHVLAENEASLTTELGLSETRYYVPTETDDVRLFIPQHQDDPLPGPDALERTIVVTDDGTTRGVAFDPSSQRLFDEFAGAVSGTLATDPEPLVEQVTDALVEQFELAGTVGTDLSVSDGRVTVSISGSVYGPPDRFDHPIQSLLGIGLARACGEPVTVEVTQQADSRAEYLLTFRWDVADGESPSG